ncbi:hypothetical protein HPB48_000780 [Haemaphysalis longicornis]|uniref:Uncharacterized protein n=1 Tax=Haemaphysalis longicornis TaxID=44386 RepID=A0A9J6FX02_HAELO|nr:hypothetical protein HPB48_000780 [Haemaphysalis longicornis]
MLQPPDPGDGEMDQSKPPDETATSSEALKNPLYEWHTVVNGKYIPVSKLNTSNAGAVIRSCRQPLLPRDEHKVIIRPRNGLQLNAIGTVALARGLSKTVQAPKEISSAWTVIIEPNQSIGIVSTPHAQAALYLKNLPAVDINGKMCEVTAYLAATDNLIKGVIHQIPQSTTEEELRDQIRVDGITSSKRECSHTPLQQLSHSRANLCPTTSATGVHKSDATPTEDSPLYAACAGRWDSGQMSARTPRGGMQ